jgi:hypothetical protein
LLFTISLPGCGRREARDEAPELVVEIQVIPAPPTTGASLLMIQISNGQDAGAGDFSIDVRGDMSHAGMTPVIVNQVKGEEGTFAVPFEWTMAGDWVITISAIMPDGRLLLRTLPVLVEP